MCCSELRYSYGEDDAWGKLRDRKNSMDLMSTVGLSKGIVTLVISRAGLPLLKSAG